MKKLHLLALIILALVLCAQPAAAITRGELDGETHPAVGLMIADIDGVPVWRCSGALIAPRVFLTAGHCTGDGATGARVWFDTDLTDNPEYPYGGVTSYEGTPVAHPDFGFGSSDPHDVGVVILDEPVTDISPATLATPNLLSELKKSRVLEGSYRQSAMFTTVGYGGKLESWPPPLITYDRVRRFAESEYTALTKQHLHLFMRAVFEESGDCFGDSGGPTFWVDDAGNEVLVAVVSTGDAQCVASTFHYRVDLPEVLDWIYAQFP